MNPIYCEWSVHEGDLCYKIDLPWSIFKKDTMVLCKVSEGYKLAKTIAIGAIIIRLLGVIEKEGRQNHETKEL